MATKIVSSFVTKFSQLGSTFKRKNIIRQYVQTGPGSHSHQDIGNIAKRGLNEALKTGEDLTNKAASTTEDIAKNSEEAAHKVAEKARQVAQEAWNSTKDTAQYAKDTAFDKAHEAKETIEETVDRSMNTKNNPNC